MVQNHRAHPGQKNPQFSDTKKHSDTNSACLTAEHDGGGSIILTNIVEFGSCSEIVFTPVIIIVKPTPIFCGNT